MKVAPRSTIMVCAPACWSNEGLSAEGPLNPRCPKIQKAWFFGLKTFLVLATGHNTSISLLLFTLAKKSQNSPMYIHHLLSCWAEKALLYGWYRERYQIAQYRALLFRASVWGSGHLEMAPHTPYQELPDPTAWSPRACWVVQEVPTRSSQILLPVALELTGSCKRSQLGARRSYCL